MGHLHEKFWQKKPVSKQKKTETFVMPLIGKFQYVFNATFEDTQKANFELMMHQESV